MASTPWESFLRLKISLPSILSIAVSSSFEARRSASPLPSSLPILYCSPSVSAIVELAGFGEGGKEPYLLGVHEVPEVIVGEGLVADDGYPLDLDLGAFLDLEDHGRVRAVGLDDRIHFREIVPIFLIA